MKYEIRPGHRKRRFILPTSYFILLASILVSCAAQQPPPGGPVDTTRPKIDTTIPHDRQINVPTDTKVIFRFDRDVDPTTFQGSFSITPYITGQPTFDWSGRREVRVKFPERLRDSTTYTVQL